MKKSIGVFIFAMILFLSVFTSASVVGDFWGKVTGNVVEESSVDDSDVVTSGVADDGLGEVVTGDGSELYDSNGVLVTTNTGKT